MGRGVHWHLANVLGSTTTTTNDWVDVFDDGDDDDEVDYVSLW